MSIRKEDLRKAINWMETSKDVVFERPANTKHNQNPDPKKPVARQEIEELARRITGFTDDNPAVGMLIGELVGSDIYWEKEKKEKIYEIIKEILELATIEFMTTGEEDGICYRPNDGKEEELRRLLTEIGIKATQHKGSGYNFFAHESVDFDKFNAYQQNEKQKPNTEKSGSEQTDNQEILKEATRTIKNQPQQKKVPEPKKEVLRSAKGSVMEELAREDGGTYYIIRPRTERE